MQDHHQQGLEVQRVPRTGARNMISQHDVIAAFEAKLAEYGVALHDSAGLKLDGSWQRARIAGDRNENLSYKIYFDDSPAGFFQDHKRGFSGTFSHKNGEDTSPEQRDAARAEWIKKQMMRDRALAHDYKIAASKAIEVFEAAKAGECEYLTNKNLIPTSGVRVGDDGALIVPTYSALGIMSSLQKIKPDGSKKYLTGGKMAGCFHPISGDNRARVLICEGYATGNALNAATGHPVACAMSCGQIKAVADYFAAKYPDREIVVMADSDHQTEAATGNNPGVEAARASGRRYLAPSFDASADGTDWDDWLRTSGTAAQLRDLLDHGEGSPEPGTDHVTAAVNVHAAAEAEDQVDSSVADAPSVADSGVRGSELPIETIQEAPQDTQDDMDVPTIPADRPGALTPIGGVYDSSTSWTALGLVLGANNSPLTTLDNTIRALHAHPELRAAIWYDEFKQRLMTNWRTVDNQPREWSDRHNLMLQLWFQRRLGMHSMTSSLASDAATAIGIGDIRNCVTDYLSALKWDGELRLDNLLPVGFGTENNNYLRSVGRCWMIGMVARALRPGCKVDTMPVFEGVQGAMKSTALRVLVGNEWFAEASESVMSKDFFQALQGKLLVEIGEMDTFSRGEVAAVKRVMSCMVDRYRVPYGKIAEDHPRMGVFAGTTNKDDWNRDETGARRFWPVACGVINIQWLRANREQLFAEAVAAYLDNAPWWDVPAEDARREQDKRRPDDAWHDDIESFVRGKAWITTTEVLTDCVKLELSRHTGIEQRRVGNVMRALGWRKEVRRVSSAQVQRGWESPYANDLL